MRAHTPEAAKSLSNLIHHTNTNGNLWCIQCAQHEIRFRAERTPTHTLAHCEKSTT